MQHRLLRRRHRRLRPGRCRAGDPARQRGRGSSCSSGGPSRTRCRGGALRPRGRPHPPVVRHRRRAAGRSASRPRSTSGSNADRHDAAALRAVGDGPSGWPQSSMFNQPELEARCSTARARSSCRASRSGAACEVTGRVDASDDDDGRASRGAGGTPVRARYVVGCDGANSTVRDLLGLPDDRPRLLLRLADRRRDPRRAARVRPDQPADLRPGAADDRGVGRPGPAPLGVHAPARRVDRRAQRRGARRGSCSRRGTCTRATPASSATPSTRSRPAGPSSGGAGACCSPATPPTRCRRSPGRACARACATPPTWRGSSTSCSAALAADALLDTYGPSERRRAEAVIEFSIELGKVICVADPDRGAARDEAILAGYDGSVTDDPAVPRDHRRHRPPRHAASRRAVPPGRRRARRRCAAASTTSSAPDGGSSPTAEPAIDDDTRAMVRRHRRGASSPIGCGSSPARDVDGAYGKWFADHGVVAGAATSRLRPVRHGDDAVGHPDAPALVCATRCAALIDSA